MFTSSIRNQTKAGQKFGIHSFLQDKQGSVAIGLAVAVPAIFVAMGCAVDIGRQINLKNEAQISLDNAMLAAVTSVDKPEKTLMKWIKANGESRFKLVKVNSNSNDDELGLEATVEASIPTSFMSIFGMEELKVTVDSSVKAPLSLEEVEVEIKDAYGYSDKVVRAMVQRPNGKIEPIITLTYEMDDKYGANWRGTGKTTTVPAGRVSTGKYTKLWFEMDVVEYNSGWTVTYSTNDPKTSNHLYVDGEMLPKGSVPQLNELVSCGGKPKLHQWEDSKNEYNWGDQDIEIVVSGKCSDKKMTAVRISG